MCILTNFQPPLPPPQFSPVVFVLSSPYGLGGRGGGLRPDPPLGGCWGGAFFSGVPQLLGGFGGAGSTSSVSVPRTGMGGGVPPPSWNTLSGISVMLTEMGSSPGCGHRQVSSLLPATSLRM